MKNISIGQREILVDDNYWQILVDLTWVKYQQEILVNENFHMGARNQGEIFLKQILVEEIFQMGVRT